MAPAELSGHSPESRHLGTKANPQTLTCNAGAGKVSASVLGFGAHQRPTPLCLLTQTWPTESGKRGPDRISATPAYAVDPK